VLQCPICFELTQHCAPRLLLLIYIYQFETA
jgi:hypothetical protein